MDCGKTVTKSGTPIKLLLGGSPCTKWSIAQKNGREVLPEGIGWELFENYRIAKEKFQPDIFLYENNKSAAQPIKDAIYSALGGGKDPSVRLTHIDSALVSAQHRQRFYVTNFGDIEQPEDRGILLRDVLESGKDLSCREKAYTLTASYGGAVAWNTLERNQRTMVAEPVRIGTIESNAKNKSRDEKIVVLSMYDGIATGRYCLDKMGFKNIEYYAYEIDPYPIKIAMSNYPDIIQCGDAFQIRNF